MTAAVTIDLDAADLTPEVVEAVDALLWVLGPGAPIAYALEVLGRARALQERRIAADLLGPCPWYVEREAGGAIVARYEGPP